LALLIAAPSSGSGKTLLSLMLTAAARRAGQAPQLFKVGPDYLDPQLLGHASGRVCRNLDLQLMGSEAVGQTFLHWSAQAPLTLVEGVMGLFDGVGASQEGSSAGVARLLNLPVVLVVEASRQGASLAALVQGFRNHDPALRLAGVVLNGVSSPRHRQLLSDVLAGIGMPLLGVLPRDPLLELPSRHLGLLPPHELPDLEARLEAMALQADRWLQLETLLGLMAPPAGAGRCPSPFAAADGWALPADQRPPRVALAQDAALHFCYPEQREWLERLGCDVRPWSPLADGPLPAGSDALVLPGGYPELHAANLAGCRASLEAIRRHGAAGRPIYAECGGMLLLGQRLHDVAGIGHPMAGLLPFAARRSELQLGYRRATALADGLVSRRGDQLWGHEFHRWQLDREGDPAPWQLEGWGVVSRVEGWMTTTLHASWLHLHWGGCPSIPLRLRDATLAAAAQPSGKPS
jgi:cobyrinic acid a,c-diamide synthase